VAELDWDAEVPAPSTLALRVALKTARAMSRLIR
jgi:hypothetical protein